MSATRAVAQHRATGPVRATFARGPVLSAMTVQAIVLTATSEWYGYDRDELYFRVLRPGWGYVDQPPLTPLVAHVTRYLLADQPWAMRIPATIAAVVSTLLAALIAREVGGNRTAQLLAAWGYAFGAFPLVIGHVLLTASIDATVWLAVLLLVIRAVLRDDRRCWWWAGLVVGLGLYNKWLVVTLLVALAVGLLLTGPRRLLVTPPVLGAVAVAILIGLPNFIYQADHGWPQVSFGRQLAAHNAGEVRVSMWFLLLLLLGPPLVAVWVAGLVALWRRPEWRPLRFLVPAFGVLLVLVFVMGSQAYYEFGLLAAVFAVGCVPTADWLARGGRGRRAVLVVLGVGNGVVSALIGLPLLPLSVLASTPIPAINITAGDSVGWPTYVREIAAVYHGLPVGVQQHTALITTNYGEAGAIDRYGGPLGLPAAYSGQNQLYYQARPPASASVAIIVGGQAGQAHHLFASCRRAGTLDNRVGVDNEEQGEPIDVCSGPIGGWTAVWPKLKHED